LCPATADSVPTTHTHTLTHSLSLSLSPAPPSEPAAVTVAWACRLLRLASDKVEDTQEKRCLYRYQAETARPRCGRSKKKSTTVPVSVSDPGGHRPSLRQGSQSQPRRGRLKKVSTGSRRSEQCRAPPSSRAAATGAAASPRARPQTPRPPQRYSCSALSIRLHPSPDAGRTRTRKGGRVEAKDSKQRLGRRPT
jgi:hypothetical protein